MKDGQNNVIAIMRGSEIVAQYWYDAWGNVLQEFKDSSDYFAVNNPIRYRSYYYDIETGYYYLQSRYYDPEIGAFISPDTVDYLDPETIGGLSLYTYCLNNPVMYVDPSGHIALLIGLLIFTGANDINNAMFANSGNILIDKPTLMSIPFYGTRMKSKIPTIFNVLASYKIDNVFDSTKFMTSAKATLLGKASKLGLIAGYLLTAWQYINLIKAIATKPDFENSRWILY